MINMSEGQGLYSRVTLINLILLSIGFILFLILEITQFLGGVMGLLAASVLLTYLLMGPVQALQNTLERLRGEPFKRFSAATCRTIAIILVYLMFLGTFGIVLLRVIPPLSSQIRDFAGDLPAYMSHVDAAQNPIQPTPAKNETTRTIRKHSVGGTTLTTAAAVTGPSRPARIRNPIALAPRKMADIYRMYSSRLGAFVLDIGATALTSLVYLLTTLVLTFYLLHDGEALKNGFVRLMPDRYEAAVARFMNHLHRQLFTYFRSQVLMSLLSGSLMYMVLTLLDVKYGLMLGFFFGLVSLIPVIGPWFGLVPITIIMAFGEHPVDIVQVLMVAGLFYIVKTHWLWPRLIHRQYDIHPIIFILTFLACLRLVGYLGLLLSFPLASILGVGFEMLRAQNRPTEPVPE